MSTSNTPEKRGTVGAPTKRTPAIAAKLCRFVERGMPFNFAASAAGIAVSTFMEWKRTDPVFATRIEAAVAKGVDARLRKIEAASADDWRAAAWLLEHCNPEHFAKSRIQVEAVGQFDHQFVIPQETLNEIAQARAKYEREQLTGSAAPQLPPARNGHGP